MKKALLFIVSICSIILISSIFATTSENLSKDSAKTSEPISKSESEPKKLNKHGVEIHKCCGGQTCCGTAGCCDTSEKNPDDVCKSKKCPLIKNDSKSKKTDTQQ